jgi:hypothetical protein
VGKRPEVQEGLVGQLGRQDNLLELEHPLHPLQTQMEVGVLVGLVGLVVQVRMAEELGCPMVLVVEDLVLAVLVLVVLGEVGLVDQVVEVAGCRKRMGWSPRMEQQ